MRVLVSVLLGVVGIAGLVVLIGLLLPRRWRVERSIRVHAGPDRIFPLIVNFRRGWTRWNPFATDPSVQMVFSGPDEGVGATQAWTAQRTPAGQMRIVEAEAGRLVRYVMRAGGFELTGSLALIPDGAHTTITWADEGTIGNPLFRYFTLFAERAVGKPFDQGLATLKREVEMAETQHRGAQ